MSDYKPTCEGDEYMTPPEVGEMKSDYIKRSDVIDALNKLCGRICPYTKAQRKTMCGACTLGDAFIVIEDDLPAVDVRENKPGRWEPIDDLPWDEASTFICSVCQKPYYTENGTWDLPYFCPHCGADMRGDSRNE